jgi:Rdx family
MLKRAILAVLPSVDISMGVGRTSSFEVVVDGKLAYSKLAKGAFPAYDALAMEIASFARGAPVPWS